uniref:SAM domain-containing protein n=1 Tax=Meloidogyne hapla TaxID=6305 RepID=A0A1I8BHR6_MELHA
MNGLDLGGQILKVGRCVTPPDALHYLSSGGSTSALPAAAAIELFLNHLSDTVFFMSRSADLHKIIHAKLDNNFESVNITDPDNLPIVRVSDTKFNGMTAEKQQELVMELLPPNIKAHCNFYSNIYDLRAVKKFLISSETFSNILFDLNVTFKDIDLINHLGIKRAKQVVIFHLSSIMSN